mmetsp:Transcript_21282/g.23613  ORF Transcript_21282/g.23613 Transcript_21282/m.23613 type:complete len:182 (-) Transcript_21282:75-620(-)|eukprot:CAMPEP_0194175862 /NCGR_PEP_ID=MMETSP0154-20130528/9869_1 /TAXON_ID=1049557 /ORGANISM="Thalassiothrix antarctica, Strain L6-D1" /LENGTH=181 /DNA_ID=CAMNT_0038889847 /DNA_START=44 /DNA_END=589 /DNA_ORIENTATION=-
MIFRIPTAYPALRCFLKSKSAPLGLNRFTVITNTQLHLSDTSSAFGNNGTKVFARRKFHSSPLVTQGILDNIKAYFSRLTLRAEASHILIKGKDSMIEEWITKLKKEIDNDSEKFAKAAAQFSDCPSGQQGGSLGEFGRFSMVSEFNKVIFNEEIGIVHGPIKTSFGFHLILIQRRGKETA